MMPGYGFAEASTHLRYSQNRPSFHLLTFHPVDVLLHEWQQRATLVRTRGGWCFA